MIRLLHVSDLHFHALAVMNRKSAALLARAAKDAGNPIPATTCLLVTGDIADDGDPKQYAQAMKALAPFKGRTLACPGNHDYGALGNVYEAGKARAFDATVIPSLGAPPTDNGTPHAFLPKVPQTAVLDDGKGTKVLAIGLNSNLETAGIEDFARGAIGPAQLAALEVIVTSAGYAGMSKLVYLHHRPQRCGWFLELTDSEDLMAVLHHRVDVVAFGHSGGTMAGQEPPQARTMTVARRPYGVPYLLNANASADAGRYFDIRFDRGTVDVALA